MSNRAFVQRVMEYLDTDNMAEVARQTGVSYNTLKNYSGDGGTKPSSDVLVNIAKNTGASLNWLLLGVGPKELPISPDSVDKSPKAVPIGGNEMEIKLVINVSVVGNDVNLVQMTRADIVTEPTNEHRQLDYVDLEQTKTIDLSNETP